VALASAFSQVRGSRVVVLEEEWERVRRLEEERERARMGEESGVVKVHWVVKVFGDRTLREGPTEATTKLSEATIWGGEGWGGEGKGEETLLWPWYESTAAMVEPSML